MNLKELGIKWNERQKRWDYPTLGGCCFCYGYTSFYVDNKSYYDPEKATMIALMQHGKYLEKWDNNVGNVNIIPRKCDCNCDHQIVETNVGRCLHRVVCTKCNKTNVLDSSD